MAAVRRHTNCPYYYYLLLLLWSHTLLQRLLRIQATLLETDDKLNVFQVTEPQNVCLCEIDSASVSSYRHLIHVDGLFVLRITC